MDAGAGSARHRRDGHAVARNVDAGFRKQSAQALIHPRRGADPPAFDGGNIAALRFQIRVHHQKPVHALGLRADQLDAAKIGKRGERRMRRTADEIDRAVAQRGIGLVDWKNQFERDIEPFGFEKSELDRRFGREIRVGNHIRDGKFHRLNFFLGL